MGRYEERMADGPVIYYRFDETSLPLRDHITNTQLGYFGDAPVLNQPPLVGGSTAAVALGSGDGATRSVVARDGTTPELNVPAFTVELGFKPTYLSAAGNTLVAHDRWGVSDVFRWRLAWSGDNDSNLRRLYVFYITPSGAGAVALSDIFLTVGTTYHLAFSYDGTNFRFYRDGLQVGAPVAGTMRASVDPSARFEVGGLWDLGAGEHARGVYDEVVFYPTALPSGRIAAHYVTSITSPRDISGLLAWYSSDQVSALGTADGAGVTTWTDLSGNGHHLTASDPANKPTLAKTGGRAGGPAMQFSASVLNGFNVPSSLVAAVNAAPATELACTVRTGSRGEEGMWGLQEASDKPQSHAPYSGRMYDGALSSGRWDWAVANSAWYRYHIRSNKNAGGNPNWSAWLDGANKVNAAAAAGYGLRADPVIGHSRGNGLTSGTTFSGRFATALFWGRLLTDIERAQVDAWLTSNPSGGLLPPPDAPTALTQTGATQTSVTVTWAPVSDATGYEYRVNGGAPVAVSAAPMTISGLAHSTPYAVEVRAISASGTSAWSSPLTATTAAPAPPNTPATATASAITHNSATVSWTAPSSGPAPEAYEYRVGAGAPVNAALALSKNLTGLFPETAYTVEVRAYANGLYSAWKPVTFTTLAPPTPNAPTGLATEAVTRTGAVLAWSAPATGPAPMGYQYRVNGGDLVTVSDRGVNLSGLTAGTQYTVEVRSIITGTYPTQSAWTSLTFTTNAAPPPGVTRCFAPVRGSAVRVTALGSRGEVPDPIQYAVSKSIAKVTINEIVESARSENLRNPEEERRLRFQRSAQTIRHTVDIDFLQVDPGVFSLVAGMQLVYKQGMSSGGFGETPFGLAPVGSPDDDVVVGFDSVTNLPVTTFALEVWSKLAGNVCADGTQRYGYTVFPFLKGGRLSGFQFANGLVSFSLIGAQTRRVPRWGVGPFDLEGPFQRLTAGVSRNGSYRMQIIEGAPPAPTCGILETTDRLDNGTPADPMPIPDAPLVVDGGGVDTEAWIIDGGRTV